MCLGESGPGPALQSGRQASRRGKPAALFISSLHSKLYSFRHTRQLRADQQHGARSCLRFHRPVVITAAELPYRSLFRVPDYTQNPAHFSSLVSLLPLSGNASVIRRLQRNTSRL